MKTKLVLRIVSIAIILEIELTLTQVMTPKTLVSVLLNILDVSTNSYRLKDVWRAFFNSMVILAILESPPFLFGARKIIHSILLQILSKMGLSFGA